MLFIENRQGWSETTLHPCLFSVALSVLSWVNSYVIAYFSRLSALFFDAQHRSDVVDGLCRELDDQAVGSLAGFQSSVAEQVDVADGLRGRHGLCRVGVSGVGCGPSTCEGGSAGRG